MVSGPSHRGRTTRHDLFSVECAARHPARDLGAGGRHALPRRTSAGRSQGHRRVGPVRSPLLALLVSTHDLGAHRPYLAHRAAPRRRSKKVSSRCLSGCSTVWLSWPVPSISPGRPQCLSLPFALPGGAGGGPNGWPLSALVIATSPVYCVGSP